MNRAELLKLLDLSSFISIDFETTGLSRYTDRIIEVAAILFQDGKVQILLRFYTQSNRIDITLLY